MKPRDIIAARNRRALLFPHMSEPEWLILIDLYANRGRDISVTSACLASFVPMTTALAHIGRLVKAGLVRREPDEVDGRRAYLRLTDRALETLAEFFAEERV